MDMCVWGEGRESGRGSKNGSRNEEGLVTKRNERMMENSGLGWMSMRAR